MMELYNKVCIQINKLITRNYSTSFTLGIQMLHKKHHNAIYSIYGFVRLADEIVDTFHDYNKSALLEKFIAHTWEAIDEKISTNPVLQSFQKTVHEYNIDPELIEAFLHSMKMDLSNQQHNNESYTEYIFGSAEVVGLMCLKVFCNGNHDEFMRLKAPAQKLGAAFQKVNFLRDMKSDYVERGRVYFPGVDFNFFNEKIKNEIIRDIEADFEAAHKGILGLPMESRFGVYVAYIYYKSLLMKIKRAPASSIRNIRIRVANREKMALLLTSWLRYRLNML